MEAKYHKLIFTILVIYTALIVYFLFFGVGRADGAVGDHEYRFNVIPTIFSYGFLTISDLKYFPRNFFELGNFAGFVPFGILIPMLYRCRFLQFITLFILSILLIETVQMLTFLGSFDVNDAIVNTLGAAVGFCAYKIGFQFKSSRKRFVVIIMSVVILTIGVICFSELLHKSFTKEEGPAIALNELESDRNVPIDNNFQGFEIENEEIKPEINVYSSEGDTAEIFTYAFGRKDILLSLNHGIPDHASDSEGKAIITVNGEEIETYSNKDYGSSEIILEKVDELTITISGNVKVWDVTFKEMKYWWN